MNKNTPFTRDVEQLMEVLCELGRKGSFRDPLVGGGVELTPPQMHAVLWLGIEGPLPMSVLARRAGTSVPACTGLVDRLERLGVVARGREEGDRRVVLVSLTGKGEQLSAHIRGHMRERLTHLLGLLSAGDRKDLIAILRRLTSAMTESPDSEHEP